MHQEPWKQVFGCDTGRWSKEPEYRSLVTVNLATGKYTMESDLKRFGKTGFGNIGNTRG